MTTPTSYSTFFQTWWDSRRTDSCVVKRESGKTLNETTGVYQVQYTTTYTGGCLVRPSLRDEAIAGEKHEELRTYFVFVDPSATNFRPDDLVDVTSVDAYLDGLQLVVRNVRGDTYNHSRRLECEKIV